MARRVAVVGVGYSDYTSIRRETREKSEIARSAIRAALDDLELSLGELDAVVYSSVDGFEGWNRCERLLPCFGQHAGLPVYSVHTGGTGGASALKEAWHMIAAELYELVLVYAGSTFNAVVDMQQILNTAMDPIFEKPLGTGAITIGAWYASRYLEEYGWEEEELARMAAQSHAHAARNSHAHLRHGWTFDDVMKSRMVSWPLREYEICPASSGATCIVLASQARACNLTSTPVWIDAIGSSTDTFLSGYREYLEFDMLAALAAELYSQCAITDPLNDFDVAELFNPFANFELLEYEALGFCGKGEAPNLVREGVTAMGGKLPVNPSGGTLCTNSGIAASLTRFAEVAVQLMGKAGDHQVSGEPKRGIAHAWGGSNGQFHGLGIWSR
ncbi:MAG: thiolase family protein, partial [Planctomycetaceae bacterium]